MFSIEEIIKTFRFESHSTAKNSMCHLLSTFLNEVIRDPKSTENIRKKATRLHNTINLVIDLRPMNMIINENIQKQSKHILKDDLVQKTYDELTGAHVESSVFVTDKKRTAS
ncbi:unnamed protein product [Rhizopus stolonifer]